MQALIAADHLNDILDQAEQGLDDQNEAQPVIPNQIAAQALANENVGNQDSDNESVPSLESSKICLQRSCSKCYLHSQLCLVLYFPLN